MVMIRMRRNYAVDRMERLFNAITQTLTNTWVVGGHDPEDTVTRAFGAFEELKADADKMRAALFDISHAKVGPQESVGHEFNRIRMIADNALPKELRR